MIISRSNPLIKLVRSLSDKSARDEHCLFVAEGVKSVKEAFSSGFAVECVLGTKKGLSLLGKTEGKTEELSDDVFKSVSGEQSPQGVLAIVKKPKNRIIPPRGNCVFLDGVMDPSNVGAIIRTAVAAGYKDVFLADCADAFNPKAVRASMGGIFKALVICGTREELIPVVDKPFVIADMGGKNVFSRKSQEEVCLVIGNEGHGVSERMKNLASEIVSIPMQNGIESLNAAVSAGILMYALLPSSEKQ